MPWGIRNPNPVRGTGRVRLVDHQDGTPGFEMLDQYTEVLPPGIPWGRLTVDLVALVVLALAAVALFAAFGWFTGAGFTAGFTTCATHLAHSPIPSALPSAPVH